MALKTREIEEFGDFQTPTQLAREICCLLSRQGLNPASILEPTCGEGNFLTAALEGFPTVRKAIGIEINETYVGAAQAAVEAITSSSETQILRKSFFNVEWPHILESLPEPLLIIGNPPWVTNTALVSIGSSNLPVKSNFHQRRGIEAITGKSNFDISEWMLLRALEWIDGRQATLAMLCKTSVARKVLLHAWKRKQPLQRCDIYHIDAPMYFGAAVDACLLVVTASSSTHSLDCQVHEALAEDSTTAVVEYRNGHLVTNAVEYERWKHLEGEERYKWRSGIKHDCSKVMELRKENGQYRNGFGEKVDIEEDYLFPMMKSSDITNRAKLQPSRWMLVTQRFVGEDTSAIENQTPKMWSYLLKHAELLDRRASSIYRNRPRFSIFGVGHYSFAPWKVAISGFYKKLDFKAVGPAEGKPVALDDTCYFIPCWSKDEALLLEQLLNSDIAKGFYSSRIFWDTKRPVTIEVLRSLDLLELAREFQLGNLLEEYLNRRIVEGSKQPLSIPRQMPLF